MKSFYVFVTFVLSTYCFSQDSQGSIELMRNLTPFKDTGIVVCRRDWMMTQERMNLLKQQVKIVEDQLASLSKEPFGMGSTQYVQLFSTEYEVRIEFDGQINEHFCVSDSNVGKVFSLSTSGEASFDEMEVYGGKYLVISSEDYYLGNCQKLTTVKEYYIRQN
jgi:hypothetical protein